MKREKIELSSDELMDLWDGVYYESREYELNGESYKQVKKINTSDKSDGPSWDYIVKRKSDDKFFKFHIWESSNGYIFEDKFLIEVFENLEPTYK